MSLVSSRHDTGRSAARPTVFSVGALSVALLAGTLSGPLAATVHGQTTPPAAAAAAPANGPTANLVELMRGIFFPTANMIFNVQTHDPAEKKVVATGSAKESLDWNQWGASLFSGWEDVDYAASALAEVTPLLLTPGRLCQNGKPVPVTNADWVKYTTDMLQAARKSYEASRTRKQDAVSDSTNDLADACQACHRVYRDRRSPGATPGGADPASLALRCTAP